MTEPLEPELWKHGINVIAILIGLLILCATAVAIIYFKNNSQQAIIESNSFFKSQSSTRLLTVLVVVSAVCVLSLFKVLNNGVIAILSGITGYVLGGIPAIEKSNKNDFSEKKSVDFNIEE